MTALANQSGAVLGSAMSCPEFEGSTTLLGEGRCVWAKAEGQVADGRAAGGTVRSTNYRIAGQAAVAPNWRLGGSFGGGVLWSTENGSKGSGQTFDGSVALKYTDGPWLFAGSLAAASGSYRSSRLVTLPGGPSVLTSTPGALLVGGRLRAAYDVPLGRWYVRPTADLDVFHIRSTAFNETGASAYALRVGASGTTSVSMTPSVEIGNRFDIDAETILRTYASVGVTVTPDNRRRVDARFGGSGAGLGSFQTTIDSPDALGVLSLGAQLYRLKGLEVRAEYTLRGAEDYTSHGGSLRAGFRF